MDQLTAGERSYLEEGFKTLDDLRTFLSSEVCSGATTSPLDLYRYLAKAKLILGNLNLRVSFAGNLMAKEYLLKKFPMIPFDVAKKPQGAPGLDIDARTTEGARVIGEIKTTDPYLITDLGAAQKTEFRKDFEKLRNAKADYKFFFVTEERTFDAVKKKYAREIPGISIVLLTTGENHIE